MASALDGIRIIELAHGIAGPYTGMLLAEQGADVIKVEPPHGDTARGTPGFHVWNRSKRSIVADVTQPAELALLEQLATTADVVLADFPPDRQPHSRLGYDSLAQHNPGLIYCHLLTEVLQELTEYDQATIARLLRAGVMKQAATVEEKSVC